MNWTLNWTNIKAALIRFFWTIVFPGIGFMVSMSYNAIQGYDLSHASPANVAIVLGVGGALYAIKKKFWPDTTW
ncbi:MAG TPA: hypothetical protein P5305_04910 [Rubrivivax sp.]|nr:hypothetical protein [Rubrivivax sp.]